MRKILVCFRGRQCGLKQSSLLHSWEPELPLREISPEGTVERALHEALQEIENQSQQMKEELISEKKQTGSTSPRDIRRKGKENWGAEQEPEVNPFQIGVSVLGVSVLDDGGAQPDVAFSSPPAVPCKGGRGPKKKEGGEGKSKLHRSKPEVMATRTREYNSLLVEIQLQRGIVRERVEGYFKMSSFDLKDPVVKQRVQEAWENETAIVKDDRRRWARGWIRVKRVLQEVHKEKEEQRRREGNLEKEVAWRKENLSEEPSEEEVKTLEELESRLREKQLEEARRWRIRSRTKWLAEEEAPSRYFFAKMKAKWAQEKIEALEEDEGEVTTDRQEILDKIHQFYSDLFSAEECTEDRRQAREAVVGTVSSQLTEEESDRMSRVSDQKEIEEVVFRLKKNKAPGIDGLTAEVLQLCWEFVGADCVKFVHAVWAKKSMLATDCQAVIRLIHKGGTRQLLGVNKVKRSLWGSEAALLLLNSMPMQEAPALNTILRAWFVYKKELAFSQDSCVVPSSLPVSSLRAFWLIMKRSIAEDRCLDTLLKSLKHTKMEQAVGTTSWREIMQINEGRGVEEVATGAASFQNWLAQVEVVDTDLHKLQGWKWSDGAAVLDTWKRSTQDWSKLACRKARKYQGMNRRWGVAEEPEEWAAAARWRHLWSGAAPMRNKIWIWRMLQKGLFTLDRAKKWGKSDGICMFCQQEEESLTHLFWDCRRLRARIQWIGCVILGDSRGHPTLLQVMDAALKCHSTQPGPLILLSEFCRAVWLERNKRLFEEVSMAHPNWVVAATMKETIQIVIRNARGEAGARRKTKCEEFVQHLDYTLQEDSLRLAHVQAIFREVEEVIPSSIAERTIPDSQDSQTSTHDTSSSSTEDTSSSSEEDTQTSTSDEE
ncbi:hypothetical protein R1sor_024922 [Riccia sorocarpa]|uniref:Reverse transcriptase zinc-binding domain-containing protein n=1 Tax=Riccia sorocarpa TaxID=122646 RepID=A0ABD3GTH0_9MARC